MWVNNLTERSDSMEQWKSITTDNIKGFYSISNYGRVRNDKRNRIMKTRILRDYESVGLKCHDGIQHTFTIHTLVAKHFIPNDIPGLIVNHKDGNKRNNFDDNLEWCTYSENAQHAFDNNLRHKGEKHYNHKYSDEQVHEMCQLITQGYAYNQIAEMCQLDKSKAKYILSDLRRKKTRKDISTQYDFDSLHIVINV